MTWVNLRPGWRDDLRLTIQALSFQWRLIHLEHAPPCPQPAAIVSIGRLGEVVDRCSCATLRFRPVGLR